MKNYLFIVSCFLLLFTLNGCVKQSKIPTEEEAEQVALNYMYDKYGIDVNIQNNETHRVGFVRYQQVSFSLPTSDLNLWYDVYVSYDEFDKKTPIVISDTYMNEYLRPLLTEYLNTIIGTEIAKVVNVYSKQEVPKGFPADFPVISNANEMKSLIVTQNLSFDYWIYVDGDIQEVEEKVNNSLELFEDDDVTFHIIRCSHEQFKSMSNQVKEHNDFDLLVSLDRDEILINTLETATN